MIRFKITRKERFFTRSRLFTFAVFFIAGFDVVAVESEAETPNMGGIPSIGERDEVGETPETMQAPDAGGTDPGVGSMNEDEVENRPRSSAESVHGDTAGDTAPSRGRLSSVAEGNVTGPAAGVIDGAPDRLRSVKSASQLSA